MMHLIVVRHGRRLQRSHGHLDPLTPLDSSAHDEVTARAQDLRWLFQPPSQKSSQILTWFAESGGRHREARKPGFRQWRVGLAQGSSLW